MRSSGPIVVLGEVLAVLIAEEGLPLGAATRFALNFAGAESNVAVALSRLEVPAAFVGRVGGDALGAAAVRHLRGEGIDVDHVTVDAVAPTGVLVRSAPTSGPTEVVYARAGSAGSRLVPEDVPAQLITSASALHLTGITPVLSSSAHAAARRAVEIAVAAGVPISFDPNVRRRLGPIEDTLEVLREFVPSADVVLTGLDEARLLSREASPARSEAWFLDQGVQLVVVKDGARGAWANDGTQRWSRGADLVVAVDAVGAGDAFDAGFLSVYRRGGGVREALERGAVLGATTVTFRGDTGGLPHLAQLGAPMAPQDVIR